MTNLTCPNCGSKYHSSDLGLQKCKNCKTWLQWYENTSEQSSPEVTDSAPDMFEGLDQNTKAIVLASNRNTHAVRALGLWLFTSVNTLFIWSNLSNLAQRTAANCKEYYSDCGASGWDTLSWIVISVGLSLGVYFGVKELNKSAIR
jgi:hypothetical protein